MSIVRAEALGLRRGSRPILESVSFTVERGEVLAVIGPNGAGKSTLLAALAGLVRPCAGQLTIDGRVAAALQAPALASRSALENVELALSWAGVPRAARTARARRALALLGADDLADQQAATLSGGQARRVHLARAVAIEPDLLLLDEPFAGLDDRTHADLLYDSRDVLRSADRATVVVVHDRADAWALADRALVILDGRIAANGTPSDVFDRPTSEPLADLLGFRGRVVDRAGVRRLRVTDVAADPDGDVVGIVRRLVPTGDGVHVDVTVDGGQITVLMPLPGPQPGDQVRLRVTGGVRFPASIG